MVIDSHFHVWPDAIAAQALGRAHDEGGIETAGTGTAASAIATMEKAGIDRAVCLCVGNTPDRVEAANRFAGSLDPDHFIGFGSVHPDLPVEENIAGLRQYGLKGVKLHPLFQDYSLDDPRLWEILEALAGEFVAVAHIGEGGSRAEKCTPQMARKIVENFPSLDFVACHFGGFRLLDQAEEEIIGHPVYVDTAWPPSLTEVPAKRLAEMIRRHGAERVIFSSDWPMAHPDREIEYVRELGLDDAETEAILGGNMARLVGLA